MKLKNILLEKDSDFDKNRTTDPVSKPESKLNVLFIGDGDTEFNGSYARQLLNTRMINGEIVSTEGDIIKLIKLVRANLSDQYDVVSLQYSNIVPNEKVDSIEYLQAIYNAIKDTGATLITINPPTKEFTPYGWVKWQNNESIANWMENSGNSDYNINAFKILNDKIFFQKNKLNLNKEGHSILARMWLNIARNIDPEIESDIIEKSKQLKQLQKTDTDIKNRIFKKGDSSQELRKLQLKLVRLGYTISETELNAGKFGQSTYDAVRSFQVDHELPVTGYIDLQLTKKLESPYTKPISRTKSAWDKIASMLGVGAEKPIEDVIADFEEEELTPEPGSIEDSSGVAIPAKTTQIQIPSIDLTFYKKILNDLGAPVSKQNLLYFAAWATGETSQYKNNPFATTMNWKKDPSQTAGGSAGVKNYSTPQHGVDATVATIKLGYYSKILAGLRSDEGAVQLATYLMQSKWGTGDNAYNALIKNKIIVAPKMKGNPGDSSLVTINIDTAKTSAGTSSTSKPMGALPSKPGQFDKDSGFTSTFNTLNTLKVYTKPGVYTYTDGVPDLHYFPIAGGRYNIGWDKNWDNWSNPVGTANSDFSKEPTYAGAGGHLNGHIGVDIFGPKGAAIIAPVAGKVRYGGNGLTVVIEDPITGWSHWLGHLDSISVPEKSNVQAGQKVGTLGNSGNARGTAPHLHYNIFKTSGGFYSGVPPLPILKKAINKTI